MAESNIVETGVHNYSAQENYVVPTDKAVQEKLEWFQDQKLALMIHWGPYSQIGLVESWALSEQDGAEWSRHDVDWTDDNAQFCKEYIDLNKTFNPIRFEPQKWADFAADNGFKYLIFTTKHHDGFCMWDTAYSDYKITAPDCPFHTNRYRDVVKEVFNAFRAKGIGIAAYFSKADWHISSYWNHALKGDQLTSRGPTYNPKEHPEEWQKFKDFTKAQVLELCQKYGDIDILWFDAGWVCAENGEDIELGNIVDEARKFQPGILSADRTVGGPYENYITPEQCVPDKPLFVPWESCVTVGTQFSYKFDDEYKSSAELLELLVDVVTKGGNLALNIGPQPDGRLPRRAMQSVRGLGDWLKTYGEAIYGTRICAPYKVGNVGFTQKDKKIYVIFLHPNREESTETFLIPYHENPVKKVYWLPENKLLPFETTEHGISVTLPKQEKDQLPLAEVFRLEI